MDGSNLSDSQMLIKVLKVLDSFSNFPGELTLSEDLFNLPNKRAFNIILHYLMGFVNDVLWLKQFPSVNLMLNEGLLKTNTKEAIQRIMIANPGLKIRMLSPSNFPAPKGSKVVEFFLDLSCYVLQALAVNRFGMPKNIAFLSPEGNADAQNMLTAFRSLVGESLIVVTQPEDFSQSIRDEQEELRNLEAEEESLTAQVLTQLQTVPLLDPVDNLDCFDIIFKDYLQKMTEKVSMYKEEAKVFETYENKIGKISQALKLIKFEPISLESLLTDFAMKDFEKFSAACSIELYVDGKVSLVSLFRIAVEMRKQLDLQLSNPELMQILTQLDQLLNQIQKKLRIRQKLKAEALQGLEKLKIIAAELEKMCADKRQGREACYENFHLWHRTKLIKRQRPTLPEPLYAKPPDINSTIDVGGGTLLEWLNAGQVRGRDEVSVSSEASRRDISCSVSQQGSQGGESRGQHLFREWLLKAGATSGSRKKIIQSERRVTLGSPHAARERQAFAPLDALRKPLLPTRLLQQNFIKKHPVTSSPVDGGAAFSLHEEFTLSDSCEPTLPLVDIPTSQNSSFALSEEWPDVSLEFPMDHDESFSDEAMCRRKRRRSLQTIISDYKRLKARISHSSPLSPTPSTPTPSTPIKP